MTLNSFSIVKPMALGFQIELESGNVGFWGGGKTGGPGEKLSEQGREPTTKLNPNTWRLVRELNPGHTGGSWVLSPLCHPRFPQVVVITERFWHGFTSSCLYPSFTSRSSSLYIIYCNSKAKQYAKIFASTVCLIMFVNMRRFWVEEIVS